MKSAVSSLLRSKNLSHSAISCSLLQHSSKPFSQRTFFIPTIPRNTKNLYDQRYQKLQIRTNSTSVMASSFMPEQARAKPALPLPTPLFKIGLFQLLVTPDKERNIEHVRKAIEEAVQKGAQLEIWNSTYSNDSFPVYAEDIDAGGDASPSTAMLSEVSSHPTITILYNTCCVLGTDGKLKAKHRKIHLFDIDIPGEITFMESKTRNARETPTILDTNVGRIGVGICSDIHFQELAMIYAARGAHLLCYPGAFNMTTGPLNWELLWRARCQLFPCFNLLVNSLNFTFGLIC
ncbi:Carbon-nitrogen hydrolase - like 5, partial [Theobroma cacao]